jgi:hypothetical protein
MSRARIEHKRDEQHTDPYCQLCAVRFYIGTRCPDRELEALERGGDEAAGEVLAFRRFLAAARCRPE